MEQQKQETTKIVRLAGKNLPGEYSIERALIYVRGVDFMLANAVRVRSGIDKNAKLGDLSDAQIKTLSKIVESPEKFNIPGWMLNRRKDILTGTDLHNVESELMLTDREDVRRMQKIRSYKGVRHMFGLRVRGQRTRSTGRKGKTVGVKKKKKGAQFDTESKKGGK